jgi:hypothetical protein
VRNVNELVNVVFSGLSPLVIEDVTDEDERILVRARTPEDPALCPGCGAASGRVHGFHLRTVADVSVDGRRVVVCVRVRRLVCPTRGCRHTFREQVPGVLERYQRRTTRLTRQVKAVVKELAGRAGARLLAIPTVGLSRHTALRALLRIPLPPGRAPRVIGVDDFALRRRHRYATVVIDAETHERIDVLPDRTADTLEAWLRAHPGVEVVCRDGAATYAEAIRRALPDTVQVADHWHLWHNLCEAALSEVKAHSSCWATMLDAPLYDGPHAQTTLERWHQIHALLDHDATPALWDRLRWGERAETVEAAPPAGYWHCVCVPLSCLGESGGGVVVRGDAGEGVAEPGQVRGERVGLLKGEGGESQAVGRETVEGGVDLAP